MFGSVYDAEAESFRGYVTGDLKQTSGYTTHRFPPLETLRIGSKQGNRQYISGLVGEFIIVADDVTDETRQKIEGYLAWKWGLQDDLPEGHPYETGAPIIIQPGTLIILR